MEKLYNFKVLTQKMSGGARYYPYIAKAAFFTLKFIL